MGLILGWGSLQLCQSLVNELYIFVIGSTQSLLNISIFLSRQSLERKTHIFFLCLRFDIKRHSDQEPPKIKHYIVRALK